MLVTIGILSKDLLSPKYVTKCQSLKADENTWEDLDEESGYVKAGDPVV